MIHESQVEDLQQFFEVVQPYTYSKKGSCYTVKGVSYEELENIFYKLQGVESVDVSATVMAYIEEKCKKELSEIHGNRFVIEQQRDHRTSHNKPRNTVQVTLRPRDSFINPVHVKLIRQRFITFYQRTASDLQVTSICVTQHTDLQERFPHLLCKHKHKDTYEVTGPFMHIAKLNQVISKNASTLNKNKGPAGSETSGPSPKHSKDGENRLCPICMDPILPARKETLRCKHSFCRDCLKTAFAYKPVCPTCGELYGTLTGTQPEGGRMTVSTGSSSLPGFEQHGTIIIEYHIPSGIQTVRLHMI